MELSPERSGMMDESLTYEQAELLSFIKLLQACPCLWHRFARQKFNKQSKINAYLLLLKKRKEHNSLATFESVREQVLELVKFILLKKTRDSVNDNITKTDIKQVIKNIGEEGKSTCEDDIVEKVLNCNKLLAELSFITNNYRKNLKNVVLECQFCYCSCSNYPELWAHMSEKHLHHQNRKRKKTNQNHTSQWQKKRKTYSRLSQKRRNTNATKYKAPRVASRRILKKSKEVGQQSSLIRIPYNLRSRAHCTNVQNNIFPNRLKAVISEGFLSVSDENEAAILVGKEMFLQNGEETSTSSACSELNQTILNNFSSSNIYENACVQKSKRSKKSRAPVRNRKQRLMHAKSTKTRKTKKINRDLKMRSNTKLLDDASQLNLSSSSIGLFQAVGYLSTEDSNLNNLLTQVPPKDDVPSKSSLNISVSPEGSAEFQLRKTEMNSHSSTLLAKKVLRGTQCKKSTCQHSFKSNVAKKDLKCFETEGIIYFIPECNTSFCKCLSETKSITLPISNKVKSSDVHVEQESICTTKSKQDATSLSPNLIEDETVNKTKNSVAVVNSEVKVLMNAKDLRNSEPDISFKTTTNGSVVKNMDWRQPKSFYNTEDSVYYDSDSNSNVNSKRKTPLILKKAATKKTTPQKSFNIFNTKKGTKTTGKSKYWDDALNEFSESFLKSFIQLYRKCECLWKQDHELYNNQQEKVAAYNKLLEMYKDEARDSEASLDTVKRLIRRLRFCHRQLSKGKQLGVLKRARIYKNLEFLKNGSTICFPNICSKCSLTFSNVQTLKQHARDVHNEKKPFKCCSCELRFRYKVEMSRHYKNRHKQK